MDIKVAVAVPGRLNNAALVIPLHSGKKLSGLAGKLDKQSGNAITRAIKRGDAKSTVGHMLMLPEPEKISADRLLLAGAGEDGEISKSEFHQYCLQIATALKTSGANHAVIHLEESAQVSTHTAAWHTQVMSRILVDSQYDFTLHGTEKPAKPDLKKCTIIVPKKELKACAAAVKQGSATATGMALARDLGNLAPNICTPDYLVKQARSLAREHKNLTVKVVSETQMEKLGMGAFLSVSRGSRQNAHLICMEYQGAAKTKKPTVLLGKGITFDTGGISIKPSATMDEMKFDMCGAASVFGAMRAVVELSPKSNIIGVVAAAENMPDGDASRPGDVVTTMSGQTVEILNTDAEGRLVLCDALTYVERYKPASVIDIATLTGACVVALGKVSSAIMSNSDDLADELFDAGQTSGDLAWQLPLWDEYQQQLDSNFADMANIGGAPAGAITAGCFLSRFAKKFRWAHLDIAGVAWKSGPAKGATGRPVPLLMEYLSSQ